MCKKWKKHLSNALAKAKEIWTARKRPCREDRCDEPAGVTPPPFANSAETMTSPAGEVLLEDSGTNDIDDPWSLTECRPRCTNHHLPAQFQDVLPQPPPPPMAKPTSPPIADPPSTSDAGAQLSCMLHFFRTLPNVFRLLHQYHSSHLPTHDPEEESQDLSMHARVIQHDTMEAPKTFFPYLNRSSFLLCDWFWNGGIQKSQKSFKELLWIISDADFCAEDAEVHNMSFEGAGWKKTSISIKIPIHSCADSPGVHDYLTTNLHHRLLISVIWEKLANEKHNELFHYQPYELLWNRGQSERPIHVHGELYTLEAFIQAHHEIQESPPEPGCDLERVVVALMFWSDATHLTSFGNSKLWPCYIRCKPSCCLCSHVAYFNHVCAHVLSDFFRTNICILLKLPDSFKDFTMKHFGGKKPSADFLTHCHRELYHTQWKILLDDEFVEAYKHGIVICCCDGIEYHFYPQILTYSADHPEKALLATIRNLGGCPRPWCLIPKSCVHNLDDNARKSKVTVSQELVYDHGCGVCSSHVGNLLKEHLLVPTSNTFSERLRCLGFNLFIMLVVDLMHEFELSVWKALFIYLIHILSSACPGDVLVHELDCRYCTIPVFDALLPEPHNTNVLTLLCTCAHWHALTKLCMHTNEILNLLNTATVMLGKQLRHFQRHTCVAFNTKELKREAEHCQHQQLQNLVQDGTGEASTSTSQTTQQPKTFNLQTYKLHALGDYSTSIHNFGTTDSYSTKPVNQKDFVKQISSIERCEAHIHHICDNHKVASSPEARFHIGKSQNNPINILLFLQMHLSDPATKDFLPKLKHFLLAKIKDILTTEDGLSHTNSSTAVMVPGSTTPTNANLEGQILIKADHMYRHNLMHLNYMTYDVRQAQDIINPSTSHCNIMLLGHTSEDSNATSEQHPYLYTRVLGVYHVNVTYIGPGIIRYHLHHIDFLWVRWYQYMDEGLSRCPSLDCVCFPPMAEPDVFGSVDPNDVLRCCHVILQFSQHLQHLDGKGVSHCTQDQLDWKFYYINCFVDCDMFMQYQWGLGVRHTYMHTSTNRDLDADTTSAIFEDLEEEEVNLDPDQGLLSDLALESDLDEDCNKDHDSDDDAILDYKN
ncbi:hypothetical protein BDR06DRAFT_979974 [Suillus hirtellus]|nr:hypothetical protein BDR06DRAFT_979974 [Suillus hirtellus]